jgi:hypothetical protein
MSGTKYRQVWGKDASEARAIARWHWPTEKPSGEAVPVPNTKAGKDGRTLWRVPFRKRRITEIGG